MRKTEFNVDPFNIYRSVVTENKSKEKKIEEESIFDVENFMKQIYGNLNNF